MDFKDFVKYEQFVKSGYKKQLTDLCFQGIVFFGYDFVQDIIDEVQEVVRDKVNVGFDPNQEVIDSSHESIDELKESDLPF